MIAAEGYLVPPDPPQPVSVMTVCVLGYCLVRCTDYLEIVQYKAAWLGGCAVSRLRFCFYTRVRVENKDAKPVYCYHIGCFSR